ncbi:MAG: tRNA (guanosine(37)-N1)-methyltransferase TrmD [Planctomycetaceae bacterium]
MRFDILTLFPEIFSGYLQQSLLKAAIARGLVDVRLWNFRDWATDRHKSVDDKPYGGGPGMLLSCQPVFDAVEAVQADATQPGQLVMLSPQGRPLTHKLVEQLVASPRLLLLCGRYEGFDDRIREGLAPLEISVGDFVTNGGEVPAMLVVDSVIRLVPGVLGEETSHQYDSFAESGLLEHPQYTRPRKFRGMHVPDVLLSGNHQQIATWRQEQSSLRTRQRRPDLWMASGGSSDLAPGPLKTLETTESNP